MAKYQIPIFSWQDHDLDFIMILEFFILLKSILQVRANSGPQFCFQKYGRLMFSSWFLKMILLWFMNYYILEIYCIVNVFCKLIARYGKVNKLKLKTFNFSDKFAWRCVATASKCGHSPDVTYVPMSWRHERPDVWLWNQIWWEKQLLVRMNTTEQYNMTLNATGLCYEHRHSAVKFPNFSGTSTTYSAKILIISAVVNDGKPPFLLMVLAKVNVPTVAVCLGHWWVE